MKPKLSKEYIYLARETNVPLPFLPFCNDDGAENKLFAKMMLEHSSKSDDELAMLWAKFIDGVDYFPKLPVHMRIKKDQFDKNIRIKERLREMKESMTSLSILRESTIKTVSDISLVKTRGEEISDGNKGELNAKTVLINVGGIRMELNEEDDENERLHKKIRGMDKSKRKTRKCSICLSLDCPGRGNRHLCNTLNKT